MTLAAPLAATHSTGLSAPLAPGLAPVRLWLWVMAGLVFLMVCVGGATRLTESGLSITEWKLVTGVLPPLSEAGWQDEFGKYKAIPQFAQLFPTMAISDFKFIYFWEWGHRLLGRLLGVAFALPLAFFWLRGVLPASLKPKLVALLALGGLQGLVGWWMVKSGLSDRIEVSQYRLATHLLLASLTFAALISLAVGLKPAAPERAPARLRATAFALLALVFVQVGAGAFVAGLRAGLTYNTWPLMDGKFIPPLADLAPLSPGWLNLFETVTTAQFDHRMIAYALLALALWHAADATRQAPRGKPARRARALAAMVLMQAAIGVVTLVLVVPLWAGLAHQAFAMAVLAMASVHVTRLYATAASA